MTTGAVFRPIAFGCGATAIMISFAILIRCYVRPPVDTTDYLRQAYEAAPWILYGLAFAAGGSALCFFGKRWWRIAGVGVGLCLSIWWCFLAGSLS